MGRKLLLIGGGGHCRSILDCLLSANGYDEIGIIDNNRAKIALDVSVVGTDDDLPSLLKDGWTDAFITVGSVGSTQLRRKIYKRIRDYGFNIPYIIDISAIIARNIVVNEGTFVGKSAIVNTGAMVGACAIINTGAIVEHDCIIGDFSHISPRTTLCGQVEVGDNSHVGAGTVVRQGIKIGHNVLIGAGSVVVNNIPDNVKAYGNPCRVVK